MDRFRWVTGADQADAAEHAVAPLHRTLHPAFTASLRDEGQLVTPLRQQTLAAEARATRAGTEHRLVGLPTSNVDAGAILGNRPGENR